MKLSYNISEDYPAVPKSSSPEEIADALKMKTVEVEEIIYQAEMLEHVVLGEVSEVKKHDNADNLNICQVNIGPSTGAQDSQRLQVVCGGSNVRTGMKVAMGKIGAKVRWHGEGDLIELTKAKIRGERSFGMICASDEIGLGDLFPKADEKEILDLSHLDAEIGTPLADALELNDIIFDIDNKSLSNRPDLFGHYGIAREIAAMFDLKLKPYAPPKIDEGNEHKLHVSIKDKDLCRRASFVRVDNLQVAPSPAWMQSRLEAAGMRPVNNIVDVTNYVMVELGQPMHAHDAQKIKNKEQGTSIDMTVRLAKKGEVFTSLVDDKEYELTNEDIVISSGKYIVALAGVMGAKASNIEENTKSVVLEAANFDAVYVRRSSGHYALRSDSSTRFEKSLDPEMTTLALARAVELLKECCPDANVSSAVADEYPNPFQRSVVDFSAEIVRARTGVTMKEEDVVRTLRKLGFDVEGSGELTVTVPIWRATKDVSTKEDLIEEVIRLHGYEHIKGEFPELPIAPPVQKPIYILERTLKQSLAAEYAMTELPSYSYVSAAQIQQTGENVKDYIKLDNPIAKDRPYLRRDMVTNLITDAAKNLHRADAVRIFDIGKVFRRGEGADAGDGSGHIPLQPVLLGALYAEKGNDTPFFALSDVVLGALASVGVMAKVHEMKAKHNLVHPGRAATVQVGDAVIGHIAEIHPANMDKLDLSHRTAVAEVNLSETVAFMGERISYKPVPQYPGAERDIAFVIDRDAQHADVLAKLDNVSPLVVNVELFDVYQGEHVPEGKKSMAYRIVYRSNERTLETNEVDAEHNKVREMLQKTFGAEVRS